MNVSAEYESAASMAVGRAVCVNAWFVALDEWMAGGHLDPRGIKHEQRGNGEKTAVPTNSALLTPKT